MSFFNLIEKLRRKPDSEKRRIAMGVSIGVTLVIFIIWALALFNSFSSGSNITETATPETPSPFAQIGDSFSKVFDSMSNIFKRTDILVPPTESTGTTTTLYVQ